MFKVDAHGGFERLERRLREKPRQIPFAAALALTETARQVKQAEYEAMPKVFDRPTPFTLNSLRVKSATKQDLTAAVFFREFAAKGTPANKYLGPEVFSGERQLKRSEVALAARGLIPKGTYLVPGKKAPLDKYGNLTRATVVRVLSDLQASNDSTQNRNADKKRGRYFVGRPGGAPLGVYLRKESGVEPILIAVKKPNYPTRLHFGLIAETTSRRHLGLAFERAARKVMRTAR